MDINVLKHSCFYEESFFNDGSEQNIETEVVLPDFCKPIKKILKCHDEPRLTSKGFNGQNLFIDGTIHLCILYVDDENCLQSFEHTIPISKNFELKESFDNCCITGKIKCDYLNCRAVSERKLQIKGSAIINVNVKCKKQIEIISDIDGCCVETLKDFSPATMPMGQGEKNLIIEEEISLGNGQPSIENILRYDVVPIIQEFKVINNKVITKGNLKVCVLYSSSDGNRTHNLSATLPFSQIVDIEGVHENCKCDCDVSVIFCELKQRTGEDECRSFILTAKLSVSVNAYCDSEIPVIYDAYSTNYNIDIKKSEIDIDCIKENFSDKFIAKKTLEFSDGAIGSIIDVWCNCQTNGYKVEGRNIIVSGCVIVQILTYDVDNLPNYFERPIDFEYKFETSMSYDFLYCNTIANILNSSFTILNANQLEIVVELSVMGSLYDKSKSTVITNIELLEGKKERVDKNCGIIIYFAESGERVWDIAKRYNSRKEEILSLNNCTEEKLREKKNLIIPIK